MKIMTMSVKNKWTFWQFATALRIKSKLCDVEFHVQDRHGNKKVLLAHKLIMMYYSSYLCNILSKDWRRKVYHLKQVSPAALLSLIQLLYKELPLGDFVSDKESVAAAQKLDVDLHDELCNIYLRKHYSNETSSEVSMELECNAPVKTKGLNQNVMNESSDGESEGTYDKESYDEHEYCIKTKRVIHPADKHVQHGLHSKTTLASKNNENRSELLVQDQVSDNENIYSFLQTKLVNVQNSNQKDTEEQITHIDADQLETYDIEEPTTHNVSLDTTNLCTHENKVTSDKAFSDSGDVSEMLNDENIVIMSNVVENDDRNISETEVHIKVDDRSKLESKTHLKYISTTSPIKIVPSHGNVYKLVSKKHNINNLQSTDRNIIFSDKNTNSINTAIIESTTLKSQEKSTSDVNILQNNEQLLINSFPDKKQEDTNMVITTNISKPLPDANVVLKEHWNEDTTEELPTVSDDDESIHVVNEDSMEVEEGEISTSIKAENDNLKIEKGQIPPLDVEKCKGVFYKSPKKKQKGPFNCEFCEKVLQSYSMYERHKRNHTGEKPFMCNVCGRKFTRKGNMLVHRKLHEITDKNFQCETCCASFKTQNNLKIHINRVHTENEEIQCPDCPSKFKSKYTFKQHITYKHNKAGKVECEECGRLFDNDMYLRRHMQTHSDDKPYKCKLCDQSFRTHSSRSSHMAAVHAQDKAVCEVCGKSYNSKAVMLAHYKRVHESVPPRECPVCHKVVVNYHNHMRMHRSYDQGHVFQCTECYKTFPMKMYLQQHMNIHKNKRFQCEKCEKFFTFKASLKSHEKSCGKYEDGQGGTSLLQNVKFILPPTQQEQAVEVGALTVVTRAGDNSLAIKNEHEEEDEDSHSQTMFVVQGKQTVMSAANQTRVQLLGSKKQSSLLGSNWSLTTGLKRSLLTSQPISMLTNNKRSLLANQTLALPASLMKKEKQTLLEMDQEDAVNQSLISILNHSANQQISCNEEIESDVNFTEGSGITQDQLMLQEQPIMITPQEQEDSIIQGVSQEHLMLQDLPEECNEHEILTNEPEEQIMLQEVPQQELLLQRVSEQELTEKSVVVQDVGQEQFILKDVSSEQGFTEESIIVQGVQGQELSQEDLASMMTDTEQENVQYVCILTE